MLHTPGDPCRANIPMVTHAAFFSCRLLHLLCINYTRKVSQNIIVTSGWVSPVLEHAETLAGFLDQCSGSLGLDPVHPVVILTVAGPVLMVLPRIGVLAELQLIDPRHGGR